MGRPSKAHEKRQLILDAYEKVILRVGYGQASQRRVADEAGVNQPMLHHYFSGSEDMVDALLERVVDRYNEALNDFPSLNKSSNQEQNQAPTLEQILSFACSEQFHQVSRQNEVFFSCIIGAGEQNQNIAAKVTSVYTRLLELITAHLDGAKVKNHKEMAYLIMCLILGHDWARKLGFGEGHNDDMTHHLIKLIETE